MAKGGTIEYGVKFNVDKTSLNEINSYLNKIQKMSASDIQGGTQDQRIKQIQEIKKSASEVQVALQKAFNVNLNSTNLTTFNRELAKSGLTITKIYNQFNTLKTSGSTAFKNLATELMTTNIQLKETDTLLDKMATTMGNTIKWGISSAIFNKMTNAISEAYNYTVKLDKSLNAIRVVSNASADDMQRFAKYANEAAKTMGATTLDYTEGALIYYQQGLDADEVKKRTDITLKMSNVLRTSTEDVSNYMTAIWNNFADGSETLEHYADVLVKLGANTASSSEEIATGMEKFAAVAQTVGLSYDYATAALATVVAQTRQSADTVGTAFRTIFSRLEGLKLGETLEDDTTLNKYSEALRVIGVNIKEADGSLKDMDTILDDMAEKWQDLSDAQKIATAQTVGGVRQYTTLVALMDNWDKFKNNLDLTTNATGELQRQQDTYMESVEAHLNKLKASWEGLYDNLFDEDAIKGLADGLSFVVDKVSSLVSAFGGGGNALLALGSVALRVFDDQIARSLSSTIQRFKTAKQNASELTAQLKLIEEVKGLNIDDKGFNQLVQWKQEILNMGDFVTAEQHNQANAIIKLQADLNEQEQAWKNSLKAADEYFDRVRGESVEGTSVAQIDQDTLSTNFEDVAEAQSQKAQDQQQQIKNLTIAYQDLTKAKMANKDASVAEAALQEQTDKLIQSASEWIETASLSEEQTKELLDAYNLFEEGKISVEDFGNTFNKVMDDVIAESKEVTETVKQQKDGMSESFNQSKKDVEGFWNSFMNSVKTGQAIKTFTDIASSVGMVASAISSLTHIKDIIDDKDISTGEKVLQITMSLGTAVPMLISGIKALGAALGAAMPYVVAIGIAIAAIVKVVKEYIDYLNKEEIAVKKTAEALKEAQDAYQELNSSISNYKNARDGIDKLTEGTVEFYEAMVKSNEEAQKLIDQLGLIIGQDYTLGSDGVITIKQEALDEATFQQTQEVYRRQAANYSAQINLENKNQQRIIKDFTKAVNSLTDQYYGIPELFNNTNNYITEEQGQSILENNQQTNTWLGKINTNTTQTNSSLMDAAKQTVSALQNNTIDISSAISTYLPAYLASEKKQENLRQAFLLSSLQGFGSREQLELFNEQSTTTRKNLLDYYDKKFLDHAIPQLDLKEGSFLSDWFETFVSGLVGTVVGGPVGTFGGMSASTLSQAKRDAQIDAVKRKYLEYTRNWTQTSDGWINSRTGTAIDQKTVDQAYSELDWNTVQTAYNEGLFGTQFYMQPTFDLIKNVKAQTQQNNLNESSRRRITELLTYISSPLNKTEEEWEKAGKGSLNINWDPAKAFDMISNLTEEERQFISKNWNTLLPEEIQENLQSSPMANLIPNWLENIHTTPGEKTEERLRIEAEEYNQELEKQANLLGTTADALDFFRIAAQGAGKADKQLSIETAQVVAEQYNFNKHYNDAISIYKKNEDAINAYSKAVKNHEEISYDLADAMGELKKSLKEMGLSLSGESITKHLNLIKTLLTGTKQQAEEAYQKLYNIARLDVLKTYFGDSKEYEKIFNSILQGIDEAQPGRELAQTYAEQLAQMIEDTELTTDQIKALADGLGIEIPLKFNEDAIKEIDFKNLQFTTKGQVIQHRYDGDMIVPDGKGGYKQQEVHYGWAETIEDKTDSYLVPDVTNFTVKNNQKNLSAKSNFAKSRANNKSSGSSSKPKTIDPLKEQADRYHEINTQITKVDNSLKKLQSQQNKFVGGKLIKNLTDQWKLLNTQVDNYQEKLRIANGEQAELAEKLASKGVKFNADGTIGNYMEAFYAQEDVVNNLIAQYNKLSKAQQETWDNKKTIENAKEAFSQFKTDLDRYDELVSNFIPGLQQNILDAVDKQIELNIKKFNLEITVTLDMTQAERDWNAWKKRALDGIDPKDIYGNANARLQDFYTYYNTAGNGEIQVNTRHLNDLLEELRRMNENTESVYGDTEGNRAKALEDLKTYYTQLMQSITDVIELQDELHQDLLDEMDEIQSKFNDQIESYEYLSGVINHDLKVVQMIYGEDAYDTMDKFYNMQHENYIQELDFYRQQRDFWQSAMDRAEEGTEEWEAAKESMLAAEQGMEEVLVTGLENAKADLENAIGGIFKRLNNLITSGMGLDYVNEQWDLINKNADRYLDTINKTFGIRQLEQKYVDAINKTNNISVQQKLKKVMDEQLNNLKQRDRLTQYDLERANKMYEIELARIALQEAQMNKSQMRLRRDSQGNYTYQYVANRTAIEDAQAQLNDLYNSLYNFDKERYNSILNDAYSAWVEYQEKMADAAMITDPERRAQRELLIQQEYNEYMTQIEEDYQVSRYNLQESAFDDLKYLHNRTYEEMSDYERLLVMDEIVPTWNNGIQQMIEQFSGEGGFAELTKDSWKEMLTAQQEYANETKELETVSGQTYTTIADGLDKAIGLAKEFIERNDDLIKKYDVELDKVWDVYDQIIKLREEYEAQAKAAEEAAKKSYNYYQQELKLQQQLYANAELLRNKSVDPTTESKDAKTYNNKNGATGGGGNSNGGGSSGGGGGGGITTKPTTTSTKATYTIMYYAKTNSGGNACVKNVKATEGSTHQVNYIPSSVSGYRFTGYFKNSSGKQLRNGDSFKVTKNETLTAQYEQIASMKPNAGLVGIAAGAVGAAIGALLPFASGGYTGSWENNNGRLAVLHQKELVLNEADTKNMLNTVAIMRQISSSLGENTLARLAGATAQGYTSSSDGGLFEQNVHIDATFPNVQNSREIEEALNNLVNSASQRAMENKRR